MQEHNSQYRSDVALCGTETSTDTTTPGPLPESKLSKKAPSDIHRHVFAVVDDRASPTVTRRSLNSPLLQTPHHHNASYKAPRSADMQASAQPLCNHFISNQTCSCSPSSCIMRTNNSARNSQNDDIQGLVCPSVRSQSCCDEETRHSSILHIPPRAASLHSSYSNHTPTMGSSRPRSECCAQHMHQYTTYAGNDIHSPSVSECSCVGEHRHRCYPMRSVQSSRKRKQKFFGRRIVCALSPLVIIVGIVANFLRDIVQHWFFHGPNIQWIGGWQGLPLKDICSQLHPDVDSTIWNNHSACLALLNRHIEANVLSIQYVVGAYILFVAGQWGLKRAMRYFQ